MPEHAYVYRWRNLSESVDDWDDAYPWAVSLDTTQEPLALFAEHAYALGFALALPSMFPELDPLAVHDDEPTSDEVRRFEREYAASKSTDFGPDAERPSE